MAKVNGKDIIGKLAEKSKEVNGALVNVNGIEKNRDIAVSSMSTDVNFDSDKSVTITANKTVSNANSITKDANVSSRVSISKDVNPDVVANINENIDVLNNLALDYTEILAMAHKTREYKMIYAMEVYVNDDFKYEYGLNPILKHKPAVKPKGKPVFYYAVCRHRTGAIDFKVMPRAILINNLIEEENISEIDIKTLSDKELDFMAKKTVLKAIINNNGGLK